MKVMPGPPWQPAPHRYRPSTGTGLSGQPRGPGRNGPMNSGWRRPWQKSPPGAAEHALVGVGGVVELPLDQVGEVRRQPWSAWPPSGPPSRPAGGTARRGPPRWARRRRSCWPRAYPGGARSGSRSDGMERLNEGDVGDDAAHAALEVSLHLLGGAEERHVVAEPALVELFVGAGVLGQAVRAKCIWKYGGAVVDGVDPLEEVVGQEVAVEQLGEGGRSGRGWTPPPGR